MSKKHDQNVRYFARAQANARIAWVALDATQSAISQLDVGPSSDLAKAACDRAQRTFGELERCLNELERVVCSLIGRDLDDFLEDVVKETDYELEMERDAAYHEDRVISRSICPNCERDAAYHEDRVISRSICPNCKEPIGNESSGSDPGKPEWHHLICLKSTADRLDEIRHLLHRLSLNELDTIIKEAAKLADSDKWRK